MKNQRSNDITDMATDIPTPRAAGYAMPAEWEKHAATWLAWPHNHEDWPDKFAPIPWIFAEIVRLIAGQGDAGEHVHIFIPPGGKARTAIHKILTRNAVNMKRITLIPQPTDRIWTRDSGPIFLTKKSGNKKSKNDHALADFKFNAWAKYDNSQNDDQLPAVIAKRLRMPAFIAYARNDAGEQQRFVLEGGSIDVNGAGCVLTTEECLLSKVQQRNPGFTRERIGAALRDFLGVEQVLWLDRGIAGDDTHGHIDDTARFVDPTTIVACVEANRRDPNYVPLRDNWRRLSQMRDVRGKPFTLAELPMPSVIYFDGQRLPASYANFYICNAGVLVPVFNDGNDGRALKVLENCFPGRAIIPVYCRDLVWGLGTLHCMTQQQPA